MEENKQIEEQEQKVYDSEVIENDSGNIIEDDSAKKPWLLVLGLGSIIGIGAVVVYKGLIKPIGKSIKGFLSKKHPETADDESDIDPEDVELPEMFEGEVVK